LLMQVLCDGMATMAKYLDILRGGFLASDRSSSIQTTSRRGLLPEMP
jgi:hypothetical protein